MVPLVPLGILGSLTSTLLRCARSPHRSENARFLLNQTRWLEHNDLPVEYLVRLFPESAGMPVSVTADIDHPFELPYGERLILATLVKVIRPQLVFEFGTFTGATSRLLADAAPQAKVHTLDLPDSEMVWETWVAEVVGMYFRDEEAYEGRIVQHRVNSRAFDYTEFVGRADFIFVDASHEHDDVLHDSRRALEMVSPGGLIVWDDYQPAIPGVVSALRTLRNEGVALVRIAESRLVVHRPGGWQHVHHDRAARPWSNSPIRGRPEAPVTPNPPSVI